MKIDSSKQYVEKAHAAFLANPPDLRETGDKEGEVRYVSNMLSSYERTVSDILRLFSGRENLRGLNILELGSFLGIVAKALSIASANIIACDIPEFFSRDNVIKYYESMSVEIRSFNLRNYEIPFHSGTQDCVIACELLEHMNFNPIPVIAEINRVLKPGGYFYLAMPNGSYFIKRLYYLFTGIAPGFSINELYSQLNPRDNMVVGLHWKEYTMLQTIELVTPLGFGIENARTLNDTGSGGRSLFKRLFKYLVPGGDTQIFIFKKIRESDFRYCICPDS